jgi:pantothenate kinase
VPLDGYHLTRKQLAAMPNSEEAIFRRGAAFTFDGESYLALVQKLRKPIDSTTTTIHAPSFDHNVKDPVEDDIPIPRTARILLFEGLYVAISRPPWSEAAELMDEIWFMDVPMPVAESRVAKRNYAAGLSETLEKSLSRTKASDMRNAEDVLENRIGGIKETIGSVEDDEWKSEEVEGVERDQARKEEEDRIKMVSITNALLQEGEEEVNGHTAKRPQMGERGRMDSIAELAEAGAGW